MKNDECVAVAKEDKHIILSDAIESIDNVIQHAYCILHRIQGADSGIGSSVDTPRPTLQEILNFGPDRIREKNDELYKILDEIKSAIF